MVDMTPSYVLVKGIDAGYTILGVYTSHEEADASAQAINLADAEGIIEARVECVPLNPAPVDVMAESLWFQSDIYYRQYEDYRGRKQAVGIPE